MSSVFSKGRSRVKSIEPSPPIVFWYQQHREAEEGFTSGSSESQSGLSIRYQKALQQWENHFLFYVYKKIVAHIIIL